MREIKSERFETLAVSSAFIGSTQTAALAGGYGFVENMEKCKKNKKFFLFGSFGILGQPWAAGKLRVERTEGVK